MSIQINVDPNIQHLIKGFEKGINQFNSRASSKAKLKVGIDEKSFTRPLGRITGQVNMFESAMEAANARVVAFGASTAVLATVTKVLKDIVKTSIEVEAAFADINRILGLTSNQFEKFGNQLFDTAQKTASSFQAASAAALEFSRQGLKTEEVLKRTSDALTLVRLTGINAEKAVSLLTATVNAFTDLDTTSAVNKFVAVETKFAVAARDLVEGLSRVGSAAQDAKVDFDELNALITSVQQTTGRGGAVIGNALKTIFTRLQRESTLEALERFNVTVRDVQGNILPATQVLDNFASQYDKLADSTQAYLREQVAGVFQANILSAILKDLNKEQSTFSKALSASTSATNEAEQANFKLNQTLSALLQNTGTEFAKLQKTLGDEAFLGLAKSIVSSFGSVISGINDLLDPKEGSTIAKGFLKGFANVLQGPVLVGALKVLFNVTKQSFGFLTQALPVLLNITTAAAKRAQTEEFINKLLNQDAKLAQQIFQAEGNQAKQLELVLSRAKGITNQFIAQSNLSSSIAKNLTSGGVYLTSSGVEGNTAKKIKNKAGGYMPSIRAEQSAISRGVGGAGNGAYPVVIPNFAFGGGKVGPVVANSSEVMVPNYGGSGGSAIFNQDMISAYGMPAGAVQIANKGIIPSKRAQTVAVNRVEGRNFEQRVGKAISVLPSYNKPIDFTSVNKKPKKLGFASSLYSPNAIADAHMGKGHTAAQVISKLLNFHALGGNIGEVGFKGDDLAINSNLVEIIGTGSDKVAKVVRSNYSSLNTTAKRNFPELEDSVLHAIFNQDKVFSKGYIPRFAAGRVPLSSLTSAANISKASANNPNIYAEDLVKTGYDNHFSLPVRTTMRRGMSAKTYGDKVEAEMAKNPKIKSMGYRLAHGGELHGKGNSAVDLIKTEGNVLTGVMEIKGGKVDSGAALKTGRVISENLSRPLVAGMFQGGPGKKIPYETHLVTNARRNIKPQNMAGMMRRGGKTMAGGYVPNFAKGEIFGVSAMTSGGRMGKGKAGKAQAQFEKIAQSMSQAGLYGDAISNVLRNTAKSLNLTGETIKNLEPKFKSLSNNASKGNMASYVLGNNLQQTAKASKNQKTLMQKMNKHLQRPGVSMGLMFGAPMAAGVVESMITGGASRIDQTAGQRFAGSAVSNVTSFATSGAMIAGPYGALVGGLIGLGKAAMDTSLSLEELKEKAENYDKTTEEVISASEQYIQAQKDIASGGTAKELRDAQKRAADSMEILRKSGDGLDKKFIEAEGSIDKMSEAADKFSQQRGITSGLISLGIQAQELRSIKTPTKRAFKGPVKQKMPERIEEVIEELGGMNFAPVFSQFGSKIGPLGQKATLSAAQEQGPAYLAGVIANVNDYTDEQAQELENIFTLLKDRGLFGKLVEMVPEIIKTQQETDKAAEATRQLNLNFARIKDSIKQSVKEVDLAIKKRDMAKEFADAMRGLQDSMLDGINAPILKFERSKVQAEADFANKIENERDNFYTKNAEAFGTAFGDFGKSQASLAVLKEFQQTLKSGGDISGFGEKMFQSVGPLALTPDQLNFFDQYDNLVESYNMMIQDQENQKTINQERLRIEEIKARNTQAELDAQYEIRKLQSERTIENAQMGVARSAAERGFEAREFSLEMDPTLTGAAKTRRRMGIAFDRYRSNIDLTAQQRDIDLQRIEEDKQFKIAEQERIRQTARESSNFGTIAAAEVAYLREVKAINEQAAADAEATRIKAGEDMDKFNADYKQENIRHLRELKTRTPGFAAAGLGMTDSFTKIQSETETFSYRLGTEIPLSFQNNMVNALNTAMDRADDLGDALRNAAVGFLTEIRNAFTQQAVGQIMTGGKMMFDSFGPQGQVGGYIKAQNGMYISGGRTGDRNPALLEDGEYVLNRNAVRALGGPRAIDQLNFGMAPRFQSGGSAFVNEDAMSSRMSGLFLTGDSPELAERRQQIEASIARRAARRAKRKQLTNAIISTLAMGAISGAMSAGFGKASSKSAAAAGSGAATDTSDAFYTSSWAKYAQNGGYISRGPRNIDSVPAFMAGGEYVMNNKAVKKYGLGFMSRLNGGYIPRYQSGGSVAETAAGSLGNMGSNTNNVSINVNMGANGQPQASAAMVGSTGDQQSAAQSKELGKRIESAVLQVIQKEQRVGGLLSGGSTKRG